MAGRYRTFGKEVYSYNGEDFVLKKQAESVAKDLRGRGLFVRIVKERGMYSIYTRRDVRGGISKGEWQQAFVANKKGGIIGTYHRVFVPAGEKFQERYYAGQFGKRSNI
jgi:hypothetical protein